MAAKRWINTQIQSVYESMLYRTKTTIWKQNLSLQIISIWNESIFEFSSPRFRKKKCKCHYSMNSFYSTSNSSTNTPTAKRKNQKREKTAATKAEHMNTSILCTPKLQHNNKTISHNVQLCMRWSDVNDAIVVPCRHVGGMLKANKERVKVQNLTNSYSQYFDCCIIIIIIIFFIENWQNAVSHTERDYKVIPHTTACKHTCVHDVTLLQHGIPPTWRRLLLQT